MSHSTDPNCYCECDHCHNIGCGEFVDEDTPYCTGGLPLGDRIYHHHPPPDSSLPESHQVWVWMNGMNPPRWEIRGTGLIF